jgi:transposase
MLEAVTTCPDCQGTGFVVGELSASRVRCLSCDGRGAQIVDEAPDRPPSTDDSREQGSAPRSSDKPALTRVS